MKTVKGVLLIALLVAGTATWAAAAERYLHVRVENPTTHELVRVNLPLSVAVKVIPAINHGQLRNGKIQVGNLEADQVDVRAILDALKSAPEGDYVTVHEPGNDVRVAKENGHLVAHVRDKGGREQVDVNIPWEVVQALIAESDNNQLNIAAGVKALENVADTTLVTVADDHETVRVWLDSSSEGK